MLDRIIRDEQNRVQYHYVLIDYLCTAANGQAHAWSDAEECRWAAPDELPGCSMRPETLRVLQKGFARARRQEAVGRRQ